MLVIRRRAGQSILIGPDIEIQILDASSGRVKLGIVAPGGVRVSRKEAAATREQNLLAARGATAGAIAEMLRKLGSEKVPPG